MRKVLLAGAMAAAMALGTGQAQASPITTAGDYVFANGLTGTFTSDGTKLTRWSFTTPDGFLWSSDLLFGSGQVGDNQLAGTNSTVQFISGVLFSLRTIGVYWDTGTWAGRQEWQCGGGPGSIFSTPCPSGGFTATLVTPPPPPPPPPPSPAVPEPATLALMAVGTLGFGAVRRRKA